MENRETTWLFELPHGNASQCVSNEARSGDLMLQVRLCERDEDAFAPADKTPVFPVSLPRISQGPQTGENAPAAAELQSAGEDLWRRLPAELIERTRARSGGGRVRVSSEIAAVSDLPWEWLAEPGGKRPWATVRSVPVAVTPPPLSVQPPLKMMIFVSDASTDGDLDIAREIAVVRDELGSQYEVHEIREASSDAVVAALKSFQPHIVHYIGHAGLSHGGGSIMLRSSDGAAYWADAAEIAPALPLSVRLICLATCVTASNFSVRGLSRLAHAPGELKLPTIVANRYPVSEDGARSFWMQFYAGLIETAGDVISPFQSAQDAVRAQLPERADWGGFELVIRDGSGQPLRLRAENEPGRRAAELQAQFAAQIANEIAQKAKVLGEYASESLHEHAREEQTRAFDFLSKIPQ